MPSSLFLSSRPLEDRLGTGWRGFGRGLLLCRRPRSIGDRSRLGCPQSGRDTRNLRRSPHRGAASSRGEWRASRRVRLGAPLPADHFLVRQGVRLPELPTVRWQHFVPRPRHIGRLGSALRSPASALFRLLPDGQVDLRPHFDFLDRLDDEWPPGDLRICAVSEDDHELVVWGRRRRRSD